MFGFSFGEMVVLTVVALVVVGPRNLPSMLRTLGRTIGRLRRLALELRTESGIDKILEVEGIQAEIHNFRRLVSGEMVDLDDDDDPSEPRVVPPREREYPRIGCDGEGVVPEDEVAYLAAPPSSPAIESSAAEREGGAGSAVGSGAALPQNEQQTSPGTAPVPPVSPSDAAPPAPVASAPPVLPPAASGAPPAAPRLAPPPAPRISAPPAPRIAPPPPPPRASAPPAPRIAPPPPPPRASAPPAPRIAPPPAPAGPAPRPPVPGAVPAAQPFGRATTNGAAPNGAAPNGAPTTAEIAGPRAKAGES